LPISISQREGEGRILFRRRSRNAAGTQKAVRVFADIATICTSDYLGIRFEVSSFTKAELLAAILTCERDAAKRIIATEHRGGGLNYVVNAQSRPRTTDQASATE
jgi:hypothetical protein